MQQDIGTNHIKIDHSPLTKILINLYFQVQTEIQPTNGLIIWVRHIKVPLEIWENIDTSLF